MPIKINTPFGQMDLDKEGIQTLVFNEPLTNFLEISRSKISDPNIIIEKLSSPDNCFIYCDLLDPEKNLLNGKRSQLLATFDIKGKPLETVVYQNDDIRSLRDASTSEHFNKVTLEVKDEHGELFDFKGQNNQFHSVDQLNKKILVCIYVMSHLKVIPSAPPPSPVNRIFIRTLNNKHIRRSQLMTFGLPK